MAGGMGALQGQIAEESLVLSVLGLGLASDSESGTPSCRGLGLDHVWLLVASDAVRSDAASWAGFEGSWSGLRWRRCSVGAGFSPGTRVNFRVSQVSWSGR